MLIRLQTHLPALNVQQVKDATEVCHVRRLQPPEGTCERGLVQSGHEQRLCSVAVWSGLVTTWKKLTPISAGGAIWILVQKLLIEKPCTGCRPRPNGHRPSFGAAQHSEDFGRHLHGEVGSWKWMNT